MLRSPTLIRSALALDHCAGKARCRHRLPRQFETCMQCRFQRRPAWRDRQFARGTNFLHHTFDEVVEDLKFMVEGCNKLLVGLDPHDKLGKHIMPAENIHPATLGYEQLAL